MQNVAHALRRYRFLIGVIVLLALNVILAMLLWRELQATPAVTEPPVEEPPVLATSALPTASLTPLATPQNTVSPTDPPPTATLPDPTMTVPPPTAPVAGTATATPAPTPSTAIVNAAVGLILRDAPDGNSVETLSDGAIVTLLPGRETIGNTVWQQIRIEDGREGWVAAQFLEIQEE